VSASATPHSEGTDGRVANARAHDAERLTGDPRRFSRASRGLTRWVGSLRFVLVVTAFGIVWLFVGALADFPRWWELALTLGFPFLTLLLLSLIQHSQNHDSNAIGLKLDELLASLDSASNAMVRIEEGSEEDLAMLQERFDERSKAARGR